MESYPTPTLARRLPVGAEAWAGGVHFRVWVPKRRRVEVIFPGQPGAEGDRAPVELQNEGNGYFSGSAPDTLPGIVYGFRLDGGQRLFPDPASRFQPNGPEGLSQVIDPLGFPWSDQAWQGVSLPGQVIYELHVGTFTPQGTWAAAAEELPELARAGMTVLEIMPVADFPGLFGWGYDGVNLFAPCRLYGRPDDFRRLVDRAHKLGLALILDVVYNHFGPVGNYLGEFSDDYRTDRYQNDWSEAINFDGQRAGPVREFFLANARYWIEEFHLDGFRFDATQAIYDASSEHILAAVTREARRAAGPRSLLIVAENEPQEARMVRPVRAGGYGMDALWNDDFHHTAMVRLTGWNEAYYSDFLGTAQELLSSLKRGFIYQGQISGWQGQPRGTCADGLPATAFVSFLQNHDQVANSATGKRIDQLTSPGRHRAMTALWLLAPQTPMFFQGQEFSASGPFLFFADHSGTQARLVAEGRRKFLSQFPSLATPEGQRAVRDPADPDTFQQSKLDVAERGRHAAAYALHVDLLKLRREDPVFRQQRADRLDGAVLGDDCLLVRYFGDGGDDRLLLVNFGRSLRRSPVPEPLVSPPVERRWELLWSSETPCYGGGGTPPLETDEGWQVPGEAAVVLRAVPETDHQDPVLRRQKP